MEKYSSVNSLIGEVCRKFGFENEEKESSDIERSMSEFGLKIMFSGGFSAGKSAAINTLLGRDLLTENQTPETAIASELVFSTDEYVEAVTGNRKDKLSIEETSSIDPESCDYLIWHVNNEQIKKLDGFTIVDMPGFNSGIKNHNKAILRYAGNGNAYILVIDCEEGEIKSSLSHFMNEIRNYDNNIAIAISKADKKTSNEIEEIRAGIQKSAESIFGYEIRTIFISKYDNNSREKLAELVSGFDKENIFCQTFGPVINDLASKCIFGLMSLKKGISLNETEINDEIQQHIENKTKLEKRLADEERKLTKRMQNQVRPDILSDTRNALVLQADSLASAAMTGGESFSSEVNSILRSTLVASTKANVEQSFAEFASEFNVDDIVGAGIDANGLSVEALGKLKRAQDVVSALAEKGSDIGGIYKTITGVIAITTTFIAPWLELVIMFLPEILKLFSGLVGKGKERQAIEQIKQKIVNEIIPQIISKLDPEIDNALSEMQDKLMSDVSETINQRIDIEIDGLNKAKERLETNRTKYNNEIAEIDGYVNRLTSAIESL